MFLAHNDMHVLEAVHDGNSFEQKVVKINI